MSASEAQRRRRAARALDLAHLDRARRAATRLFGVDCDALPQPVGLCPSAMLSRVVPERLAALAVAPRDQRGAGMLVELDSGLARQLVDLLLGAPGPAVEAPLTDGEAGILVYLGARLLAAVTEGSRRILGALTTRAAFAEALGPGDLLVWPVEIHMGPVRGTIRLWSPATTGLPAAPSAPPLALGALPLTLRLCRGRTALRYEALSSLRPGDAVLIDEPTPSVTLFAALDGASSEVLWLRIEDNQLVVARFPSDEPASETSASGRIPTPPIPPATRDIALRHVPDEGREMTTTPVTTEIGEGLRRVADLEVPLTIEVARLKLRLDELGRLRPGEVLGTAVSVGSAARLRAEGVDVAEGELVDLDGKLALLLTRVYGALGDPAQK